MVSIVTDKENKTGIIMKMMGLKTLSVLDSNILYRGYREDGGTHDYDSNAWVLVQV